MCRWMMLLALGAAPVECAGSLKITWTDCGDSSTHGKVSDLQPLSLPLGQKTTITSTGTSDEPATAGTFTMKLTAGPIHQTFTGDMCAAKTFSLPLNTGSITWDGVKCPLGTDPASIPVDMQLSSLVPAALQTTELTITMTSSTGDKLFCVDVHTAPAAESAVPIQDVERTTGLLPKFFEIPAMAGGALKLTWTDCGDSSTHGKVSDLQPLSLPLGQKTTITSTGNLDEAVTAGTFTMHLTAGPVAQTFTGDMCTAKTFSLPLNTGSITWDGAKCPLAAGAASLPVDMLLGSLVPGPLRTTDLKIEMASSTGDKLFCVDVKTAPATEPRVQIQDVERTTGLLSNYLQLPAMTAGTLKLTWTDCGDSSTHGKVSDLQPSSLALGQKTTITSTGSLDEAVTAGTFSIALTAGPVKNTFTGDLCAAKTFALPLGTGSLTWEGVKCPLSTGSQSILVDMLLNSNLPALLQNAELKITMASSSGDKLFCMDVHTAPASLPEVEQTASVIV